MLSIMSNSDYANKIKDLGVKVRFIEIIPGVYGVKDSTPDTPDDLEPTYVSTEVAQILLAEVLKGGE